MNRKNLTPFIICIYIIEIAGTKGLTSLCGHNNVQNSNFHELNLLQHSYNHTDLTYKISKYSKYSQKLSPLETDAIFSKAFKKWSDVANLTFDRKLSGPVDIDIRFEFGDHGDEFPFKNDGTSLALVLAHANKHQIHLNDSKNFSASFLSGTSLLHVAVHEIGHALGLGHSTNIEAIMYKDYYTSYIHSDDLSLDSDDIDSIQHLYGSNFGEWHSGMAEGSRTITFINHCSQPIWINPFTTDNKPELDKRIERIARNARVTYTIPESGWRGRFWPKAKCNSYGQNCAIGQSLPPCPWNGCQPPADTKIQFYYPAIGEQDSIWYYFNLVEGYSFPMEVVPDKQDEPCVTTKCGMSLDACPTNEKSVGNLRVINKNGHVVQCLAPCKKWNYPSPFGMGKSEQLQTGLQFCCPTPSISPDQCRAGDISRSEYVNLIHRDCPTAHSYAYDKLAGQHHCPNPTSFQITIC